MEFYGGAVNLESLENMPLPKLYWLLDDAEEITKLRAKENVK